MNWNRITKTTIMIIVIIITIIITPIIIICLPTLTPRLIITITQYNTTLSFIPTLIVS